MAGRSSRIRLDPPFYFCSVVLLPGARIKSEIVGTDCKITKETTIYEYMSNMSVAELNCLAFEIKSLNKSVTERV